jgi:hypothetical protein
VVEAPHVAVSTEREEPDDDEQPAVAPLHVSTVARWVSTFVAEPAEHTKLARELAAQVSVGTMMNVEPPATSAAPLAAVARSAECT